MEKVINVLSKEIKRAEEKITDINSEIEKHSTYIAHLVDEKNMLNSLVLESNQTINLLHTAATYSANEKNI